MDGWTMDRKMHRQWMERWMDNRTFCDSTGLGDISGSILRIFPLASGQDRVRLAFATTRPFFPSPDAWRCEE